VAGKGSEKIGEGGNIIVAKAPFRISFVGGGSDLPAFYEKSDGAVLSATIDKYVYIITHPFFERDKIRLKYLQTETVKSVGEIRHPIIRACMELLDPGKGIEIASLADIPAGTGMGSSSAFTVGLLQNLHALKNEVIEKNALAEMACKVEIDILGEPIGKQDQYSSAYGGMNVFEFKKGGEVKATPINLKKADFELLNENTLLFFTGETRSASELLRRQSSGYEDKKKMDAQRKMVALVWELKDALASSDLNEFGRLLGKNWELKKQLNNLTTTAIDCHYERAVAAGALGGKLLGAGGGGFLLFYCEPEKQQKVREALYGLYELSFRFDTEGSKIILSDRT